MLIDLEEKRDSGTLSEEDVMKKENLVKSLKQIFELEKRTESFIKTSRAELEVELQKVGDMYQQYLKDKKEIEDKFKN